MKINNKLNMKFIIAILVVLLAFTFAHEKTGSLIVDECYKALSSPESVQDFEQLMDGCIEEATDSSNLCLDSDYECQDFIIENYTELCATAVEYYFNEALYSCMEYANEKAQEAYAEEQ